MSKFGMRDSDGEGQFRTGIAVQHLSSFGFENFEVTRQRRRSRRGQLQTIDEEDKTEVPKTFVCDEVSCQKAFSSRFKLDRHLLIHSDERRFHCTTCTRSFHRKDHLKNHLQVHNPNKVLHACDICEKSYCSLLSFKKHKAFHAAQNGDLKCKLCGKVLADREGIMHHLKVHTGSRTLRGPSERKYPCDRCDRSFFTKKDVKRHLVVHTGKRDFVCQFCPQRFGRKDHLVRHTKKSHVGSSGSPPSNEAVYNARKYEHPHQQQPHLMDNHHTDNHHKNNNILIQPSLSDMNGIVISPTTVTPIMDNTVLEPIKPDPTYGIPHPNLMQSNYSLNNIPHENGQSLGRFSEPTLLPVSQYLPMSPSYPSVTSIMPHHYLNMSSTNSMLSELLPPISMASSFTSLSLDVSNPPLPHFNQAFQ